MKKNPLNTKPSETSLDDSWEELLNNSWDMIDSSELKETPFMTELTRTMADPERPTTNSNQDVVKASEDKTMKHFYNDKNKVLFFTSVIAVGALVCYGITKGVKK